jgi:multidrug transporter EmrE-like cation transporter
MSGILESAAAYIVLGDRLEKPIQYVGLVLTVVGIFLLKA